MRVMKHEKHCIVASFLAVLCILAAYGDDPSPAAKQHPSPKKTVELSFEAIDGDTPMDVICGARAALDAALSRNRSARFVLKALPASGPHRSRNALVNRELRKFCDGRKYLWNAEGGEEAPANPISISRVTAANNRWTNGVFGVRWWLSRIAGGRASVAQEHGDMDLVMLGDSITHFWEIRCGESWAQFTNGLRVANFGAAGDKVANAIWMAENGALDGLRTKAVSILIGTNDNSSDNSNPEEVARQTEKLVEIVRAKQPEAKVLLFSIFPRGRSDKDVKHLAARKRNEATNAIVAAFAAKDANVVFVDLSERWLGPDGFVPKALMADGIHPTAEGYSIWAESILGELRKQKGGAGK